MHDSAQGLALLFFFICTHSKKTLFIIHYNEIGVTLADCEEFSIKG
jgi:hypothetical protein